MKRLLTLLFLLVLGIGVYGCGGGGSTTGDASEQPPPTFPEQVAKVELTTSNRIVQTGNTIYLIARALDSNGRGVSGVAVVFTSSGVGTLSSNYQITNSDGYAYTGVFSSVAGSATVKAFNQNLSHSLDVYFADGEIKNKLKLSVDRNGNNIFDEPADFTISGTTGEKVKIKATYTDGGGAPLANKTIRVFSNSTSVAFENPNLKTDNNGNASTFMTFVNQLNTIYIDVIGEADGTVGSVSLKVQTFILGEILIYANKMAIKTDETATITACLYSDLGQPIKMKDLKINFEVLPTDIGEVLPFTFTDDTGCAKNTFKPYKEGDAKITASFADKKSELTLKVNPLFILGEILIYADKVSIKTDETATVTACLFNNLGQQIKIKDLKINFSLSPTDIGEVLPFTFTDDTGCAKNTFKPYKEGDAKITASFADKKSELTIKVGIITNPLSIIPSSPSVKKDSTILIMLTGGIAPYTVISLSPELTDPDSWTVTSNGGTFTVKGVAEGTATLVVKDSVNTMLQVTLTITP